MVDLGVISYGAYLWHYPVFIFAEYRFGHLHFGWPVKSLLILLVLALASGTYHLIEYRCRRSSLPDRWVNGLGIIFMLGFAIFGWAVHKDWITSRPTHTLPGLDHLLETPSLPNGVSLDTCAGNKAGLLCRVLPPGTEPGSPERRFLVVGDSFASDLLPALAIKIREGAPTATLDASITYGCSYSPSGFYRWDGECGKARQMLDSLPAGRYTDVILSIDFHGYLHERSGRSTQGDIDSYTSLFKALRDKGMGVWVLTDRPTFQSLPPARAAILGISEKLEMTPRNPALKSAYGQWESFGVRLFAARAGDLPRPPHLMYWDTGHFTPKGASLWLDHIGFRIR